MHLKQRFWCTFVLSCFVMHANFIISHPPSLQNIATMVSQTEWSGGRGHWGNGSMAAWDFGGMGFSDMIKTKICNCAFLQIRQYSSAEFRVVTRSLFSTPTQVCSQKY